jgi:hypothetical protein
MLNYDDLKSNILLDNILIKKSFGLPYGSVEILFVLLDKNKIDIQHRHLMAADKINPVTLKYCIKDIQDYAIKNGIDVDIERSHKLVEDSLINCKPSEQPEWQFLVGSEYVQKTRFSFKIESTAKMPENPLFDTWKKHIEEKNHEDAPNNHGAFMDEMMKRNKGQHYE